MTPSTAIEEFIDAASPDEAINLVADALAVEAGAEAEAKRSVLRGLGEECHQFNVDIEKLRSDDCEAMRCLQVLSEMMPLRLREAAWLYARTLRLWHSACDRLALCKDVQDALLSCVERWIGGDHTGVLGYADIIAACLVQIDRTLLSRYGVGSRAIVGTLILLKRQGAILRELSIPSGPSVYGFCDLQKACREGEENKQMVTAMVERLEGFLGGPCELVRSPLVILLHNTVYSSDELRYRVPWCEPRSEYPFANVDFRVGDEINCLTDAECRSVVTDILT